MAEAAVQRYSAEIPWVLVDQTTGAVYCEVCREVGHVYQVSTSIPEFAEQHRVHAAPPASLGLGDLVARIAKPLAGLFGKAPCTPCEQRRRQMNGVRRPW